MLYSIHVLQRKQFFQSWVIGFLLLKAGSAEVLRIWTHLKNHIVGGVQAPNSSKSSALLAFEIFSQEMRLML